MSKLIYPSISELYNPRDKYLFLGNGINQLESVVSWDDLLRSVCGRTGVEISRSSKTCQLFFEQMAFSLDKYKPIEENIQELKRIIGEEAMKLEPNAVLRAIIGMDRYQGYMTTNYDYTIEKAISPSFDSTLGKHLKRPKYSAFRYNILEGKKVWHMHGECDNGYRGNLGQNYKEASILIGFEHYADYLEKIHRLLKDNRGKGLKYIMEHSKENWVHLFFSHDIDILGFGLDYSGTHIRFILNFRARLIRKKAKVKNRIRWVVPSFSVEKNKDRIEPLVSLGIVILEVEAPAGDYARFYKNFIIGED